MGRFRSRLALAGLLLTWLALPAPRAAGRDADHRLLSLQIGRFDPHVAQPPLPAALRLADEPEAGYFVVQLESAIDDALLARLRANGAEPLSYLPDRAYLVRLRAGAQARLRRLAEVRWLGPVQPGWKLSPDLGTRAFADPRRRQAGRLDATIELFPGEDPARVADSLAALGLEVRSSAAFSDTLRLRVRATRGELERAAAVPAVAWIEEAGELALRNAVASWVIQTDQPGLTAVWDRGLHGEGQIIGIIDGALDMDSCYFRDEPDNTPGPTHRKVVAYRSTSGIGADPHGTHVAGSAAGAPFSGSLDQAGQAHAARLSHTNADDLNGSGADPSNLYGVLAAAHADGARVHGNSWGDDDTTAYTTWSRDADLFSHDFEDALVIFAVSNRPTVRTPENAKNVLAVGASQNGLSADDLCSGGSGPTSDGRRKPELFAPGCGVLSALATAPCDSWSLSGTSMAAPAVAGAAALVRQYFLEGWYPSGTRLVQDARLPSGALVKATLLNSAVDMSGIAGFPGDREGWGRLLLENALYFAGDTRRLAVVADVRNADGLTTAGTDAFSVDVGDSAEPLKITLVYTDPPASLLAAVATINDLDLEVIAPTGELYRGNVFDAAAGVSLPGGSADPRNNVETVLIPAPAVGPWSLRVRGAAVNQGSQGYALVATGSVTPVGNGPVRYGGHAVDDAPPGGNGNGLAEPGETITLPIELFNLGPATATDVSARLFSGRFDRLAVSQGLGQFPDLPSSQGALSLAPHFEVTISPATACGESLPMRLRAEHDARSDESSFQLDLAPAELTRSASDTPLVIPQFEPSPAISTIDFDEPATIGDLLVWVQLGHDAPQELRVDLTSPEGTTVRLHDHGPGTPGGLVATFDTERQPVGPGSLADFDGEQAQGSWSLAIVDDVLGFPSTPAGTLLDWRLIVTPPGGAGCQPLACPGDPLPAEVAPTMTVALSGTDDLRFAWEAVAGAAGYRVWRSADRDFSSAELLGTSATTELIEPGGRSAPGSWYYRVRALNSCNWEGP